MIIAIEKDDKFLYATHLDAIKLSFLKMGGVESDISIITSEISEGDIESLLLTQNIFGTNRLFILEIIPTSEWFQKNLAYLKKSSDIVVIVSKFDARKKVIKAMFSFADKKILTPKDKYSQTVSISQLAKSLDIEIHPSSVAYLEKRLAGKQSMYFTELQKLGLYADGRKIMRKDIEAISSVYTEEMVFAFQDAVLVRNTKEAIRELEKNISSGVHPLQLLSLLGTAFRNLLRAKSVIAEQNTNAEGIQKALKVHPFVAKKLFAQCRGYSFDEVKEKIDILFDMDIRIKKGHLTGEMALLNIIFDGQLTNGNSLLG